MTNTVDLHLLPRIDQQNDTRRTSSPGGCCCFSGSRRSGSRFGGMSLSVQRTAFQNAPFLPLAQRKNVRCAAHRRIPGIHHPFGAPAVADHRCPMGIASVDKQASRSLVLDLMKPEQFSLGKIDQQRMRIGRFVDTIHLAPDARCTEFRLRQIANASGPENALLEIADSLRNSGALGLGRTRTRTQDRAETRAVTGAKRQHRAIVATVA
ncbi:MAG: hypothetical protein E5X60_25250, partial [Mesorhizobium sp.]